MNVIKRIIVRFFKERYYDQSAQAAYYLLLSTLPFLLVVLSLASLLPLSPATFMELLQPYVPEAAYPLIEENVRVITKGDFGPLLPFSLAAAFWVSSMAVQSLARSLDEAIGVVNRMSYFRRLLHDLGVTLLFMLIIPLSLLLPVIDHLLHVWVSQTETIQLWRGWEYVWPVIRWGFGSLFLFGFFLTFFKVLPSDYVRLREVLPGALFTTVAWQSGSILFNRYADFANYSLLYGQLSGIILLILWFFLTAVILLVAGLLNAELRHARSVKERGTK